jgi:hypothetical protein
VVHVAILLPGTDRTRDAVGAPRSGAQDYRPAMAPASAALLIGIIGLIGTAVVLTVGVVRVRRSPAVPGPATTLLLLAVGAVFVASVATIVAAVVLG